MFLRRVENTLKSDDCSCSRKEDCEGLPNPSTLIGTMCTHVWTAKRPGAGNLTTGMGAMKVTGEG
jgi:hypothetical protein